MTTIGSIRTRRWNDPQEPGDGFRILVTRYRPRALPKSEETWDLWEPDLGPSKALHAQVYGKIGDGISWTTYLSRYRLEMRQHRDKVVELARRVSAGQTITLLCSSQCVRESRCHRSILMELIEAEVKRLQRSTR